MKIRLISTVTVLLLFCSFILGQGGDTDYQYALIEAVKQKNLGNIPGAIELYKLVLKENDSVSVAHYELGTLLAMTGKKETALSHLEKAHMQDPEIVWYLDSYVNILLINKEFKRAVKVLKNGHSKSRENVEVNFKLANVYFLGGKSRKAIRTLDGIEKKYGISDKIIRLKANIYEKKKDYDKARKEVDRIIELFPESVEYYVIAAELALKSKNSEPAVDYYLKVLELDSTNIFAITNLTDYYRDRKEYEKSFYYLNKSFRSSEIDYSKKMAILSYYLSDEYFFNNHTDLLEELILTMLEKYEGNREIHLFGTDFFIQNKKYKEALNSLIPILNEKEKKYELWRQGIYLANAIKQFEEMLTLAESAMKIFPDSVEVIYYKGIAEFESEKYNNFIKTFSDKNIKSTKNREIKSQARILLAEAYNKLENYPKSDSLFRSIILEEPKNFAAMNNFGYYLSIRNESLQEAKRISYIAIENNPDNGTYLDTYAWILYKLKDYKNAELFILEALKKGGINDPDINEHAAEIHKAIGSYELARSFYQKAIVVGGDKEKLIQKLEEIKGINGQ